MMKTITLQQLQGLQAAGKVMVKRGVDGTVKIYQVQQLPSATSGSTGAGSAAQKASEEQHLEQQELEQQPEQQLEQQQLEPPSQHYKQKGTKLLKEEKGKADWSRQATLALLASYEARDIRSDHSKKNQKFWNSVADELNSANLLDCTVSGEQVRWKWGSLKKAYNKKKDYNNTSGNDPKEFDV